VREHAEAGSRTLGSRMKWKWSPEGAKQAVSPLQGCFLIVLPIPRADALGCYGVTCQYLSPTPVLAGCFGTLLFLSGHLFLLAHSFSERYGVPSVGSGDD